MADTLEFDRPHAALRGHPQPHNSGQADGRAI